MIELRVKSSFEHIMSGSPANKIAIICDELVSPGGEERIVRMLYEEFPGSVVYTAVLDEERHKWLDPKRVHTTFIQKLPGQSFWRLHYIALSPLGFEQFDLSEYDLVISVSAGCAKGVITRDDVPHIGIVLTPPRHQWERIRKKNSGINVLKPFVDGYLRVWDVEAGFRPDVMVAISEHIKNRVQKVYRREAHVIYPGVDQHFWEYDSGVKREDFYLVVSRLYYYKRIDLAIEACESLGRDLVIIGEGPEEENLREIAGERTRFLGFVDDKDVKSYMQRCRAFLFPGIEDFGMAPVEAMSCGAPVITLGKGGVAETVKDGSTGVHFPDQTRDDIVDAMKVFERNSWDHAEITKHAAAFSKERYINELKKLIDENR